MLFFVLAAGLALGPRPPQLVMPGEESAYADWLADAVRKAAGHFADKDCSSATLGSIYNEELQVDAPTGRPDQLYWQEVVQIQGCGPADVQRLIAVRTDEKWRAIVLAPGRSVADLALQNDILPKVAIAAAALASRADPDCAGDAFMKTFQVVNTEAIGWSPGAPWAERWTINACRGDYGVDVHLDPAPQGGTNISIEVPAAAP